LSQRFQWRYANSAQQITLVVSVNNVPQDSIAQLGACSVFLVTVMILAHPVTLKLVSALSVPEIQLEIIAMNVSLGPLGIHQEIYLVSHASVVKLDQNVS